MIQFYLVQHKEKNASETKKALVAAEALPCSGDYVYDSATGLEGVVREVMYWWDRKDEPCRIEVVVSGFWKEPNE